MHRKRIGVVSGGPSNEYEVSLATGKNVIAALKKHHADRYSVHDIFIDRAGNWHKDGAPLSLSDASNQFDVIFNALHGAYGEDGKIQQLLEMHQIPFTGSGSVGSAVAMNKMLAKKTFTFHGIKTPHSKIISEDDAKNDTNKVVSELFRSWLLPTVVKPVTSGSSVGVSIARKYDELAEALLKAAEHGDVMLEEFISGIEATCGVIEGFRGQELYVLPPIEIRPLTGFFDFDAKYAGKSQEIVPASFSHEIKKAVEELAMKIHRALGLKHYSRSDFIIHPRRGIYALEVNTLPGLTDESLIPKSLRAVGSDTHELIDHLIRLALN